MLINKTVNEFLSEIDSESTAPGGGSVSALLGALGVSLARMYGHVSFTKKTYKALDEEIRIMFENNFAALKELRNALELAIDTDTMLYNKLVECYRLPKNTEEEINVRNDEIYKAAIMVTNSPLKMMELSYKGLELLSQIINYVNKNAKSDAGVAAICLFGAINGAYLNVKINLGGLNQTDSDEFAKKASSIIEDATILYNQIMKGF